MNVFQMYRSFMGNLYHKLITVKKFAHYIASVMSSILAGIRYRSFDVNVQVQEPNAKSPTAPILLNRTANRSDLIALVAGDLARDINTHVAVINSEFASPTSNGRLTAQAREPAIA